MKTRWYTESNMLHACGIKLKIRVETIDKYDEGEMTNMKLDVSTQWFRIIEEEE